MFSFLTQYLTKILAVTAAGAVLAAFVLWLWGSSLSSQNTKLEATVASQEVEIIQYKKDIVGMVEDQKIKDAILIQNKKDKEASGREVDKLKADLKRLTDEANDKCLDTPIPSSVLERLRTIPN